MKPVEFCFIQRNTELDALVIIKYYKARFQIEFLFRDAKQYTGFTHCQSRKKRSHTYSFKCFIIST
ncbi:hypothetical protein B9G39_28425 [Zooshikella ganghwensis]|uniref:Transposase IS4-like domain-containing protein n=1 Tax=Zooshikella ganghwensis TaxID=202772 RepID=A0A4P9VGZ7_9GAMM|nr:hypothetical protein B9G39_28425 [Zooshikella ganghwensis]